MRPANLLKIETLSNDWRDKDIILLHACFQLLKNCVEDENLLNCHIDWEYDERHRQAKHEIEELYQWWASYVEPPTLDEEGYNHESEMLKRLVAVRWACGLKPEPFDRRMAVP
ncbi:MAG: hypothetical protein KDC35_17345 [Acidobacteria bacterium]|nr:hypothetical protein [Acidobacteriota bacterium]